jgi:hypothetical protein
MTAKKMGFVKGEWALQRSTGWPVKLLTGVHTNTPTCYVVGWVSEVGSLYATDLIKLDLPEQIAYEHTYVDACKYLTAIMTSSFTNAINWDVVDTSVEL